MCQRIAETETQIEVDKLSDDVLDQIYHEFYSAISPAVRLASAKSRAKFDVTDDRVIRYIVECRDRFLPPHQRQDDE